ncbi:acyltransferase [Citrobacter murliniae]
MDNIFLERYADDINFCVADFNVDKKYNELTSVEIGISGDKTNKICYQDNNIPSGIDILYGKNAKNSRVYIRSGSKFNNVKVIINSIDCCVYIGQDCDIKGLTIAMPCRNDSVIIGAGVVVTKSNTWTVGLNHGCSANGIIVGDHCLIAADVCIRASDGHLILDIDSHTQINKTKLPVIIEPYCWLGQRASILKNVRVGGGTIVSFGAIVTKSFDKLSVLCGVPAKNKNGPARIWQRNNSPNSIEIRMIYEKRYIKTS